MDRQGEHHTLQYECTDCFGCFPQTALIFDFAIVHLELSSHHLKVRIGDWILLACVGVCFSVSLGTCCNCDIFTVGIFRLQTSYRYFAGYQVVSSDIHGYHGPNKTYSVNQNAFWFPVSSFLPVQVCIFQVSSMM